MMHDWTQRWFIWGLVAAVAVVQASTWLAAGRESPSPALVVYLVASWIVMLALAVLASWRFDHLRDRLTAREREHRATLEEIEQLQTQNVMLDIVARSVDVPLTFQALAVRIARLVPCDRVGLALLTETGQEFETFTARVHEGERRIRPRPDVVFKIDQTAIGSVVRTLEPLLLASVEDAAADFLDLNVLRTAGFKSALILPLVSKGRGVGTLNLVARRKDVFSTEHISLLTPIAEILAVAHLAQQLHMLLGKYRTIEAMSEVMLSIASEINSALQTIIGHCDLLAREHPDAELQQDLSTIVGQAGRIAELLERMRSAAHDRLRQVANTMEETGIPTSPDAFARQNELI